MAIAGARQNLAKLRVWCEENPTVAKGYAWACVDFLEHEAEMAEFAGLDEVPTGLWPTKKDERVVAAVQLTGWPVVFGSEGLGFVDVSVMLMHGGGEETAPPFLASAGVEMGSNSYESVESQRKARVVFDYGGALMFNSSCKDNPGFVATGFPMFCSDPVWDIDRAHDLINHFATAFLLAELKGDAEAAKALAPENVTFPGIQHETTGYGE